MIPNSGDLIKIWLLDEKSEWKHTKSISWNSVSGSGSADSPTGFIAHPLSQHLEEVLWIHDDTVENPLYTDMLSIADPEFFEKLRTVLTKMTNFFKQNPDRNSDLNRKFFSGGPVDYTGKGSFSWSSK